MKRYVMHLVHRKTDDRWHLEHNGRSIAGFDSKAAASEAGQARGRALSESHQDAQLVIHLQDGSIEKEYTYGHDPEQHPG